MKHVLLRIAGHTIRWTWVTSVALAVLSLIAYGAARYYLPTLLENKASIEHTLERLSGQKITITRIDPWWDGIHPGVRAEGVQVYAPGADHPSVALDEVRVSVALLPLVRRTVTIYSLVVVHPQVVLERMADNRLRITGFGPVSMEAATSGRKRETRLEDNAFMAWLFAQRRMAIQDGLLKWVDRREPRNTVQYLKKVNLALENHGKRHHLSFTADFPEGMCAKCALDVDVEGNPLVGTNWGGRVNIDAFGLDTDALPLVVRESIPGSFGGRFDLRLRTQWSSGVPRVAQGFVDASKLRLPGLNRGQGEIRINRFRAGLQWRGGRDVWQLDVKNALIGLGGKPWAAGYVRVDHSPTVTRVRVKRVDLTKLASYLTQLGLEQKVKDKKMHEVADAAKAMQPAGTIEDLAVQYDGRADAPTRWMVQGQLNGVHVEPYKKLPGIDGFSGYLLATDKSGELRLNTGIATFRLPWMFREPIPLRRALGRIRWERKNDRWSVNAKDLRVAGDAVVQGDMQMQIPFDHSKSPHLAMRFSFFGGNGAHASRYYPANRLHKKLLHWLDDAIVSGELVRGHLVYDGPTREYPFERGEGTFEVQARLHNVVLDYLKGWPAIRGADATLLFRGPSMLITADSGHIRDLHVSDVVARKAVVSDKTESVVITGRVSGPVATAMDVLRHAPETENGYQLAHLIAPGLVGEGEGALNLHIDIPHDTHKTHISGEYRFLGGALQLPVKGVRLTDMRGSVRFSPVGIENSDVRARLFNQPTVITAETEKGLRGKETVFRAHGSVQASDLGAAYGRGLDRLLSGSANWNGIVRLRGGLPYVRIESDLANMHTSLPKPFDLIATPVPQTILETVVSDPTRNLLSMRLGKDIAGLFDFRRQGGDWQFNGGQIALGATHAELPDGPGLEVLLRAKKLDGDSWIDFIRQGTHEEPGFLTRISADVGSLTAYGRDFGDFAMGLNRRPGGWSGKVGGSTAEGTVAMYSDQNTGRVTMNLDRLRVPKQISKNSLKSVDPRTFPSLDLRSRVFVAGDTDLGALNLSARHTDLGWRIDRLNLDRTDMHIRSSGTWYVVVGHDSVDYDLSFDSNNLEQTLAAFGAKDVVRGGRMNLKLGVHWREDRSRPGLRNLDGTITMNAKSGSILNINQGAARIAGLFNLQSLGDMLTLNFKPAVGSGFVFSDITGRVAINGGTAYTDGINIRGTSANVVAHGKVNLVDQNLDLAADIYPNLRDPVTFATGWLWGPQTAAWVLALQEIFRKDIEKGTRISYKITGTLSKPHVTKTVGSNEKSKKVDTTQ